MSKRIQVVTGVIKKNNQYLIALRPAHKPYGNLWEFPGGKCELNEAPLAALKRELKEELDINVLEAEPFFQLSHDYTESLQVDLDVWRVVNFTGEPQGNEGQAIKWVSESELARHKFPEANAPILKALTSKI